MNMEKYPHITIAEDGSFCSMGQHRPGFPRVLYDALRQLGYNGDAHDQDKCEVNMVIPLNPMESWMATVIGSSWMRPLSRWHKSHSPPYVSRLADTTAMPIALFPIHNQENPVWKQRLETVSNPEGPHFHIGMAALAGYA
jgi:hypothetical protein